MLSAMSDASQFPDPGGRPRRIVLLGRAGAGKTTFSSRLAAAIGGEVICLDAIWRPGWGPDQVPAFRALMQEAHAAPAWVSDGNFAVATFDIRLPLADLVIWLDPPVWLCAWRAVLRVTRSGEAHRPSGLPKVLRFIYDFDRVNRPRIEALRLEHAPQTPVLRLASKAEIQRFLAAVDHMAPQR